MIRRRLAVLVAATMSPVLAAGAVLADPELSVESILKNGWEIAGYATGLDNRSSLLLFKHKERTYLIQCAVLCDVTRTPHTRTNCYEVR